MALAAGSKLGSYEVVAPLGSGGMGEVYQARDTRLKRDVAIKALPEAFARDPERLARFEREAEILASLNHPNIAAIHNLHESDGLRFLVLELVHGETLAERIGRGALPMNEVLNIASQIAHALEAAHDRGIIHRDLKPANIKILPEGKVKVLDFGLAKIITESAAEDAATMLSQSREGVILGTPAYMSPEQARGKPADARTDIWAFGCVLYEMLTGHRTFPGDSSADIIGSIMKSEPDWSALPAETAPSVRTLIRRCLQKDPARRLRHIADAGLELNDASVQPGMEAVPASTAPGSRTRETIAWSVALILLLGLITTVYVVQRRQPSSVIRFEFPVAQKSRLFENPGAVISPDGQTLAYVDSSPSGQDLLWLRRIDSLTPTALEGTQGAYLPFWAPDSKTIGFFAPGKLKRVSIAGGSIQELCEVPSGAGGSWNKDGVILFSKNFGAFPLYRVSENGGRCLELRPLNVERKDGWYAAPAFAPDGEHFVFSVGGETANAGIYIGSLNSEESTLVLRNNHDAIVSSNGFLLFADQGRLYAQKLDLNGRQLVGDRVVLGSDIFIQTDGALQAGISVSNDGILAYRASKSSGRQLAWFDRRGVRLKTIGPPGNYVAPVPFSDEYRVTVARDGDILVIDTNRGDVETRITDNGGNYYPVPTPDGRYVLYVRNQTLFQKLANGTGQEEKIADGVTGATEFTRDGNFLSFFGQPPNTLTLDDLFILPMSGNRTPQKYLATNLTEYENRLSPDQKFMAYGSEQSGRPEVYVQTNPISDQRWQISLEGGVQPIWSWDGKELFYLALDGTLMSVDVSPPPAFDKTVPRALFRINGPVGYTRNTYLPSRDGKRFLVNAYVDGSTSSIAVIVNWPELVAGH